MKGVNRFHINQSTMREAIAYWLKHQILRTNNFEVKSVKRSADAYKEDFEIELEVTEEEEKGKDKLPPIEPPEYEVRG